MDTIDKIIGSPSTFLNNLMFELGRDNINVQSFYIDHICYRVSTNEKYHRSKNEISKFGKAISEKEIGGRQIAIYKLEKPILYHHWKIDVIELPAPKKDHKYSDGLQHAEFVITPLTLDEFVKKHPMIQFDTSSMCNERNPSIERAYEKLTAVFHLNALEKIVQEEK